MIVDRRILDSDQILECPLVAEAVEEVFPPLKTEILIRLMTALSKNESRSAPPGFHCFTPPICRGFFDSLGYKRTLSGRASEVRFAPESRHRQRKNG